MMIVYAGGTALTPFRQQQWLRQSQQHFPALSNISVQYLYLLAVDDTISLQQQTSLAHWLPQATQLSILPELSALAGLVLPRTGSISPWSSKATEMARQSGFAAVHRIERGRWWQFDVASDLSQEEQCLLWQRCYDPLVESVLIDTAEIASLFHSPTPGALRTIAVCEQGREALQQANHEYGLALSDTDLDYLLALFCDQLQRDPTDIELMMFAQVNSEHCRHKIFNGQWTVDGVEQPQSLFQMIRHTYATHSQAALVAYDDNAAVLTQQSGACFFADPDTRHYCSVQEAMPIVFKVETHNHPTAIAPHPGAATGSGGEIRDEAATGRGSQAKAGMCGFSVSHLHIPQLKQAWEADRSRPAHIASPLQIMLEAPIGAASFNNEFGRPNICGYFRSFEYVEQSEWGEQLRAYHKPIMIAGGLGHIRPALVEKKSVPVGARLAVLGGPALRIGLGGGSASSRMNDEQQQALDFASVQRANPEMQRRAQEVINHCWALGEANPILSIHDVGAGGLSNALPELVHDGGCGARIALREILSADSSLSPMEIWCNEAQERYVLAIDADQWSVLEAFARRERCPLAAVGVATDEGQLRVDDAYFANTSVEFSMDALFEKMPPLQLSTKALYHPQPVFSAQSVDLSAALEQLLQFPAVASKSFLITIGDRSVGGKIARDQMVGPWQVPVADVGVTCSDFEGVQGEAIAVGERAPVAILNPAAAARMAVGEAITNIAAAPIASLEQISLSANWMAAMGLPGEGAALYAAVKAIALELCPSLGIAIPVGKDSLSMQLRWQEAGESYAASAPLSLVITAAAPVTDVTQTLTPVLMADQGELWLIDLGAGCQGLGGSCLAQVYQQLGGLVPDVDATRLRHFFDAIQALREVGAMTAYHDRSDGGVWACLCEMAFASHCGLTIDVSQGGSDPLALLATEELGAVIEVPVAKRRQARLILEKYQLLDITQVIAEKNEQDEIVVQAHNQVLYRASRVSLQRLWSRTSYELQRLRDDPACAESEYDNLTDKDDPGLQVHVAMPAAPALMTHKPRVAILREQGVNGHVEMAAAFTAAGCAAYDVHMSDLIEGRDSLIHYQGLVACGGFSYGDVLGAGRGWAQAILSNALLYDMFSEFFQRESTISLGVCNGCQMLSYLSALIPGAAHWPRFVANRSEQFESRLVQVEVMPSHSLILQTLAGSILPVVVAHGEGQAIFDEGDQAALLQQQSVVMRYLDHRGNATEVYPFNPNGSVAGITGCCSLDGRVTMMMPHPERLFRLPQWSWAPAELAQSPWMRLFQQAASVM